MGTEVQFKSFLPRYYSTKDINHEDSSNGCNWPLFYTDRNGQLPSSFQWVATAAADASHDYDKFTLKRKMLEHEAVFKKQVHELHRLYRIQKDLMDEIKRKELSPYNSSRTMPPIRNGMQASPLFLESSRPSKMRNEKFDLQQRPAVVYIDLEASGENEVHDRFDLNQPAQMEDTGSSEFVHPQGSSFFENMAQAHRRGSTNGGQNDSRVCKEKLCVPSQPRHNPSNEIHKIPAFFSTDQFIVDQSRLLPSCGAESSKHQEQVGFPIFGKSLEKAPRIIDINLPCDPDVITEEAPSTKKATLKCEIDLNCCIDEDEVVVDRKMALEIDLEAPAFADEEESSGNQCEMPDGSVHDEALKMAAEAIVAISLDRVEDDEVVLLSPDNLNWFVNIALRDRKGMDYFELMTLKLADMDEEEHLPKMFEVEDDDVGPTLTNRVQRGQRRRGRQQKRDFQRDILPGMTSLSRQEVAEDIQAFGGLMRATGHIWELASRKGSSRGRPRRAATRPVSVPVAVDPTFTPIDMVRLEEGSLMGWGKTRRPRRQRCPARVILR